MAPNDAEVPTGSVDEPTRQRIESGQLRVHCAVCRSSPARQAGSETGPNLVGQLAYGVKTGMCLAPDGAGLKMLIFTGENRPDTAKGHLYIAADVEVPEHKALHQAILDEGFTHHLAVAFGDIRAELKTAAAFYGIRVVEVS